MPTQDRDLNSEPAELERLARLNGENTRQGRDQVTPKLVVTGNNSDKDMRRYLGFELERNIPVTWGFNGAQCSGLAFNLLASPRALPGDLPAGDGTSYDTEQAMIVQPTGAGAFTNSTLVTAYARYAPPSVPCLVKVVPNPITGLNTVPDNQTVTLQFGHDDPADLQNGPAVFEIYRATSSTGPFVLINTIGAVTHVRSSSYVDLGPIPGDPLHQARLVNGTTYYYKVIARNCKGASVDSGIVTGTPKAAPIDPIHPPPGLHCVYHWYTLDYVHWQYRTIYLYDFEYVFPIFNPEFDRNCASGAAPQPHIGEVAISRWYFETAGGPTYHTWVTALFWIPAGTPLSAYERSYTGTQAPYPPDYHDPFWNGH